jgi:hypothetical protein
MSAMTTDGHAANAAANAYIHKADTLMDRAHGARVDGHYAIAAGNMEAAAAMYLAATRVYQQQGWSELAADTRREADDASARARRFRAAANGCPEVTA